jgi:uncharacterized protein YrrD
MLQLSGQILNRPVLSLRTGGPRAWVVAPVFNPSKLSIEGFYVQDRADKKELILLCQDIREISRQGFIVNDHDVLATAEDLVRLKELLDTNFELLDKHVETASKQSVGKVSDYAVETSSMIVQKIYASQSFWKNLTGGALSIDRSQIVEVTNQRIVINELLQGKRAVVPASAPVA